MKPENVAVVLEFLGILPTSADATSPQSDAAYAKALEAVPDDTTKDVIRYIQTSCKFRPSPAELVRNVFHLVTGTPEPEEAWCLAMTLFDGTSVAMTSHILECYNSVKPMLDTAQFNAARFAFERMYSKLIQEAIMEWKYPKWRIVRGDRGFKLAVDKAMEEGKISQAEASRLLELEWAKALPPADNSDEYRHMADEARKRVSEVMRKLFAKEITGTEAAAMLDGINKMNAEQILEVL